MQVITTFTFKVLIELTNSLLIPCLVVLNVRARYEYVMIKIECIFHKCCYAFRWWNNKLIALKTKNHVQQLLNFVVIPEATLNYSFQLTVLTTLECRSVNRYALVESRLLKPRTNFFRSHGLYKPFINWLNYWPKLRLYCRSQGIAHSHWYHHIPRPRIIYLIWVFISSLISHEYFPALNHSLKRPHIKNCIFHTIN